MSILSLAQWSTGSERVKVSVKNQNNIRILLKWIEKWLTYKIQTFWIVSNFFWFCLTFSVSEKLKNSVFEIPVIPENLNTSKLRTTNTKSINLHTTEKLITYSLKNFCVKGMFAFTVFEILLFEYRLGWYYYLPPPKPYGTGSNRVNSIIILSVPLLFIFYFYTLLLLFLRYTVLLLCLPLGIIYRQLSSCW